VPLTRSALHHRSCLWIVGQQTHHAANKWGKLLLSSNTWWIQTSYMLCPAPQVITLTKPLRYNNQYTLVLVSSLGYLGGLRWEGLTASNLGRSAHRRCDVLACQLLDLSTRSAVGRRVKMKIQNMSTSCMPLWYNVTSGVKVLWFCAMSVSRQMLILLCSVFHELFTFQHKALAHFLNIFTATYLFCIVVSHKLLFYGKFAFAARSDKPVYNIFQKWRIKTLVNLNVGFLDISCHL